MALLAKLKLTNKTRDAVKVISARKAQIQARLKEARADLKEQMAIDTSIEKRRAAIEDAVHRFREKFERAYDRRAKKRRRRR